ncbi:MAG TPA: GntR family transcriptional regulator [Hyphomicrobiaceae bacterium]|jgi:GntR family transcriptional regulator|nr:GntR family transcriptional regulator [Hyphomicrobiaceae bacterium]
MSRVQLAMKPIYQQLRDLLAERIAKGDWKPGAIIPNEGDLAREFGVSAGTMRKALSLLENEHLITRRQGRGTFINDPVAEGFADRFCSIRGANGKPMAGRVVASEITQASATATEAQRLQLTSGDAVWHIRRVRFDGDSALMYEEVSLPAVLFPALSESSTRIVLLAHQYGLLLGRAEEKLSIGAASEAAAEALQIPAGSPVIVLDRVLRTIDGRPVEWRLAQCRVATCYLAQIH